MKHMVLLFWLSLILMSVFAQKQSGNFQFALVSDTHIGNATAAEDLKRTVKDINGNDSLSFVIISGDITEFGADKELLEARQILDSLNKPWYVIPGNHDTKWSESGGNSFRKIFGAETFAFRFGGYLFIGTNSGPNMRMGPGQVPRENIVWLDSLLQTQKDKNLRIVYVNHYPQNNSLNNWYEILDRLKTKNIQLILCGHGHTNHQYNFEGIPGLMGRSNLRAKDTVGGYNIMRIYGDSLLTTDTRYPLIKTLPSWASVKLFNHHFADSSTKYSRPDFSMNNTYSFVKETWRIQDKTDIGTGVTVAGNLLITSNTGGWIRALDKRNGNLCWQFNTGAKIYGTPAVAEDKVIEAVTDGKVYALSLRSGKLLWTFDAEEPIVASPMVHDGQVFIAGSGGKCYSISVKDGKLKWSNTTIEGFVETIPLLFKGMICFGTWANHFYALDEQTGKTRWDWVNGYSNRMYSPAACVPVAVRNRIFLVAPDRKMTCLDAGTGQVIWQSDMGGNTVRESMGISADSSLVYAKTMDGNIIGVSTSTSEGKIEWKAAVNIGYDIAPSVINELAGVLYIPTDKGLIYAIQKQTGKILWIHRISSCLINQVLPVDLHTVFCTSMDGVITKISF